LTYLAAQTPVGKSGCEKRDWLIVTVIQGYGMHFPPILSNCNGVTAYRYICRLFILTTAFLVELGMGHAAYIYSLNEGR